MARAELARPLGITVGKRIETPSQSQQLLCEAAYENLEDAFLKLGGTTGKEVKMDQIRGVLKSELICELAVGQAEELPQSDKLNRLQAAQDLGNPNGRKIAVSYFEEAVGNLTDQKEVPPSRIWRGPNTTELNRRITACQNVVQLLREETSIYLG